MIWRWLICFSALAALAPASEIAGRVVLRDSREHSVVTGADFSGVVISLSPLDQSSAPPPPRKHARMLQKNKTFTPHVLAVQVGTKVDFPNLDPIFHNAFSSYSGQIFDVGLYPPGTSRSVTFDRPGVVRVFCNIHPFMSAIILVVDSPYFATTAKDGRFSLNAPPGSYVLRVFHERSSPQILETLSRKLEVGAGALQIPVITISEAGYLPVPHSNKYGKAYPPDTDERSVYPGVRK